MNALMFASKRGDTNLTELLIQNGHDVNHVTQAGWNALMIASFYGRDKVIEILIRNGSNVNAVHTDGWNALMLAALNGHEKVIKLLNQFGCDVNAVDNEGTNALMIAAINGHKSVIELLIKLGCDVNAVDYDRANAIIIASKNGTESTIEVLTTYGCNVNAVDSDNLSALMYASYNGDVNSVKTLIRCGCDIHAIDNNGNNALMMACDNENENVIEQLIKSYTSFEYYDFDVTNLLFSCNKIMSRETQINIEITVDLLLKIVQYDPLKLKTNESLIETLSELDRNDQSQFRKKLSCILWHIKDKSSVCFDENAGKYLSPYVPSNWEKDNRLMGQGASGSVYELSCENQVTNLRLAVKEIFFADTNISNHLKEVNIMLKLQHKRIMECFGFDIKDKTLNIFLEYMPIGSLTDYIRNNGPLEEEKVLLYIKQLLEGVSYLHNFNPQIIHRDIKGNILVKDENNIKLADFGISKILDSTCPRTVIGTTKYMAPEVVLADNDTAYTIKADIWSVGCTIVEMVTGKPPFPEYPDHRVAIRFSENKGPVYELSASTSNALREQLDQIFNLNPLERPTSDELLQRFRF